MGCELGCSWDQTQASGWPRGSVDFVVEQTGAGRSCPPNFFVPRPGTSIPARNQSLNAYQVRYSFKSAYRQRQPVFPATEQRTRSRGGLCWGSTRASETLQKTGENISRPEGVVVDVWDRELTGTPLLALLRSWLPDVGPWWPLPRGHRGQRPRRRPQRQRRRAASPRRRVRRVARCACWDCLRACSRGWAVAGLGAAGSWWSELASWRAAVRA